MALEDDCAAYKRAVDPVSTSCVNTKLLSAANMLCVHTFLVVLDTWGCACNTPKMVNNHICYRTAACCLVT